jgi:hypothetical protein
MQSKMTPGRAIVYQIKFTDDGTIFGSKFETREEAEQQKQRFWRMGGRDGGTRHLASAIVEEIKQ